MKKPFTFPTISRPMLPARITLSPGPELRCGRSAKREEGPSRILNRGAMALPRGDGVVSAVEWRGVGDKPAKGEKPACSPKGVSPLFRVREGPSSRSLSAKV
ncbi:MAG: hypothetical protein MUP68_18835 [Deltaproteobacteria bacterium]|nr:hypothetical protein [Deltaproteobacteria bacterium]